MPYYGGNYVPDAPAPTPAELAARRAAALQIQAHGGSGVVVPDAPAPAPPAPGVGAYGPGVSGPSNVGAGPGPAPGVQNTNFIEPNAASSSGGGGGAVGYDIRTATPAAPPVAPAPAPAPAPPPVADATHTSSAAPITIDETKSDETRSAQIEAIDRARKRLDGGSSLAQTQLRDTLNANIAQQQSQAAGARGMAVAGARRLAARQIGSLNQGAASQFAGLRAQEETADINTLAGIAGQARGQDIQVATGNAELDFKVKDMEDRFKLGLISSEDRNRQLDEMIRSNQAAEAQAADNARNARDAGTRSYWTNIAKSAAQAVPILAKMVQTGAPLAVLAATSDVRAKENIATTAPDAVDAFISSIRPHDFDYKADAGERGGRRTGVMVQDIERTPVGRSFVTTLPSGYKGLDVASSIGPILVALRRVNDKADAAVAARRKAAREI